MDQIDEGIVINIHFFRWILIFNYVFIGWWQGVGPDGTYGLFPANYVELID